MPSRAALPLANAVPHSASDARLASRGDAAALTAWRNRPLAPACAFVFCDGLTVTVREDGQWVSRLLHLALTIAPDGGKDIAGCWIASPDDPAPSLTALTQLKARGVNAIGFAVVEDAGGLTAARRLFPRTTVLRNPRGLIRAGASQAGIGERTAAIAAMTRFLAAADTAARPADLVASHPLLDIPALAAFWQEHWPAVEPVLALAPALRRLVVTTSAVESVSEKLRRRGLTKRQTFPSAAAACRDLAFVLRDAKAHWTIARAVWNGVVPALHAAAAAEKHRGFPA